MKQSPEGIALLLTVIVVGVTGFTVMAFIARSGIASLRTLQYQEDSMSLEGHVYGCIEELMAQNLRDPDFNAGTLSIGSVEHTINTIDSGPEQKTVEIIASDETITRREEVTIGLDPVSLISIN